MNAAPTTTTEVPLEEKIYLSGRRPTPVKLPPAYKSQTYIGTTLPSSVVAEIVTFMETYNKMFTGNITQLSPEMIGKLTRSGSYCAVVRAVEEPGAPLVGSIFTLPVDAVFRGYPTPSVDIERGVAYEDLSTGVGPGEVGRSTSRGGGGVVTRPTTLTGVHSCYTSYLCVRPDCRSQGLAMALIRLVMNVGWPYGVRSGYYMCSKPHHRCHTKLQSWYRPLHLERARQGGFSIPEVPNVTRRSDGQLRLRLFFRTGMPKGYTAPRTTVSEMGDLARLLPLWESNYKVHTWGTGLLGMVENFDVHWVEYKGRKLALFALIPLTIYVETQAKAAQVYQLGYLSIDPDEMGHLTNVLTAAGSVALGLGACVLHGYQMGPLADVSKYKDFHPMLTESENHLEFYNADFIPKVEEINLPIL